MSAAATIRDLEDRIRELEAAIILFQCIDWDASTEHDDLILETVRDRFDRLLPRTRNKND